jgi:hypothetical protein
MKTISKVLVGVGTQSGDITRICIEITPVHVFADKSDEVELLIEPMTEPDIFGRTHEVFALLSLKSRID